MLGNESLVEPTPALAVEQLTVRYGDFTALSNVSLRLPVGSIAGLIGRNGAGKTTIVRLLAGLLRSQTGSVEVLGKRFDGAAPVIRRQVGYLLDTPALFSYLTAEETLLFLAEVNGLPREDGARRTEDLLCFFGLSEPRHRLVNGFSTGMQKRLALAAALIHSPRLLVLDEPFESLDPLMVRKLKDLLVRFASNGGSVLLSSHLIDTVQSLCDRVVILERGEVIVAGTTSEALAGAEDRLPAASLEELYISVVHDQPAPDLPWLNRS